MDDKEYKELKEKLTKAGNIKAKIEQYIYIKNCLHERKLEDSQEIIADNYYIFSDASKAEIKEIFKKDIDNKIESLEEEYRNL